MIYGSVCSGIEVGQKFGRLSVVRVYHPRRRDQARIECRCECGVSIDTVGSVLRAKKKLSCGCFRRDRAGGLYRTHGKSKTPEYCMFYDARKRAMAADLPFDITPADITIPADCPVLGIPLMLVGPRDHRPSLDRVHPNCGYVVGNVCVISFRANRIKSDATAAELRQIIGYIEGGR